MRSPLTVAAALLPVILAGCVLQRAEQTGPPAHANAVIVREFAFSPGVVTLDPSFGFSLYRGAPGVPPAQRAASVGRAAAFNLADAVTQELSQLGYDVVLVEDETPVPSRRALVVGGDFHRIYEGHRHANASVEVGVEVDYQAAGAPPQRLISFDLDSRQLRGEATGAAAEGHGAGVGYEASRVGAAIGRYVADLAEANRWPAAATAP